MSEWWADGPMVGRVVLALGDLPAVKAGWASRRPSTGVGDVVTGWLAGFDLGQGRAGVSALTDEPTFLRAVRSVTDTVYAAAAVTDGASGVVDRLRVTAGAPQLAAMRRLYPDATVLTGSEPLPPAPSGPIESPRSVAPLADLEASLVIVLGSPRSGTTWLVRLLTSHPQVTSTDDGETWLFRGAGRFWHAFERDGRAGLGAWIDEAGLLAALRRCCDDLLLAGRTRLAPAATHLVEKTPAHVAELPLLEQLYPGAAYVHIIRDGRDVAHSLSELDHGPAPGAAAASWVSAVRAVQAAAPRLARLREQRYEALYADPVTQTTALLDWIGVPRVEGLDASIGERVPVQVSPLPSKGSVGSGKWRSLRRSDISDVNRTAGALLAELGYD